MGRTVAAALVLLALACDEPASKPPSPPVATAASKPAGPAVATAVRAAMAEMFAYSEKVFAIVRQHRDDCDAMAGGLAELAPTFRELGPRMMAVKNQMASLPEAEQKALAHEADQLAEGFRTRIPDMEALEQRARECEKSSPAFAKVAPQVMFMKKKSGASD